MFECWPGQKWGNEKASCGNEGLTEEGVAELLRSQGLHMITRFQHVHALCEERERGRSVLYELFICCEEELPSLNPVTFQNKVSEAVAWRKKLGAVR